ncbi:hypothetical protein FHR92_003764 [Fontibacillus solani]|uniref:Uncharacterized protein n=1 Tax=Fontibacillus solani TaxID=1572857 RepID=A0A7W3SW75_9BACL|nr:hypothetical protein [Fontibacillus solani]MBA9087280.1 hypothetical protein [Fontibacillus solani]
MELQQQITLCINEYNVDQQLKKAEAVIREEYHDSILATVIDELGLDDWDEDLETAPEEVLSEYESMMQERIDVTIDDQIADQVRAHIKAFFDETTPTLYPEEMASLEKALLLKKMKSFLEFDAHSLRLAGLIYSDKLPHSPFVFHQISWATDDNYRSFIQMNYEEIITLTQDILEEHQAQTLGTIPNVEAIIKERWQEKKS